MIADNEDCKTKTIVNFLNCCFLIIKDLSESNIPLNNNKKGRINKKTWIEGSFIKDEISFPKKVIINNEITKKTPAIVKHNLIKKPASLSFFAIVTGTKYLKVVIEDKIVKYDKKVVNIPN